MCVTASQYRRIDTMTQASIADMRMPQSTTTLIQYYDAAVGIYMVMDGWYTCPPSTPDRPSPLRMSTFLIHLLARYCFTPRPLCQSSAETCLVVPSGHIKWLTFMIDQILSSNVIEHHWEAPNDKEIEEWGREAPSLLLLLVLVLLSLSQPGQYPPSPLSLSQGIPPFQISPDHDHTPYCPPAMHRRCKCKQQSKNTHISET